VIWFPIRWLAHIKWYDTICKYLTCAQTLTKIRLVWRKPSELKLTRRITTVYNVIHATTFYLSSTAPMLLSCIVIALAYEVGAYMWPEWPCFFSSNTAVEIIVCTWLSVTVICYAGICLRHCSNRGFQQAEMTSKGHWRSSAMTWFHRSCKTSSYSIKHYICHFCRIIMKLHCVSKKPGPWNLLLRKCFNINKNWYTQPAYDVIKIQYYETVVHITLAQQYWNAPVITSWFLYHRIIWVNANNKQ